MKKHIVLTILSLFIGIFLSHTASGRIYLDITSPDFQKMPIAVPFLLDKAKADITSSEGKEMARLIGKGLEFHGFVSVVPADSYGGKQDVDWSAHGVDYAVLGQFEHGETETTIELRFVDVQKNEMIFGKRYRGSWDKRKQILFKFCDDIIEKLTGEKGVCQSNIAFVSDLSKHKEIYITDVLGEQIKQVTSFGDIALSPRFSSDGQKLFYTSYHKGNPDLYLSDIYDKEITTSFSSYKGLNMTPAFSPGGKKMAVTLSKDGNPDLYLLSNNGTILKQLTKYSGINVSPSWSPDGNQLAFVSDRSGSPQIYIMDVDKDKTRRITYIGSYNTSPNWSPKGDLITYAGFYEGNYQIFTINPDGAAPPTQVTTTWGDHEAPSWAPDGRQIVFARRRDNNQELCKIFRNGIGLTPILQMSGNQSLPQWSPRLDM
jgi:TolB protein